MAEEDKGQSDFKVRYGPPNDARTERMLRRWDARCKLADRVRDLLGR